MRHLEAVEQAVKESTLDSAVRYIPLIELCRVLASQLDAAGTEPSTRLTAAYLSALKDLNRAINSTPVKSSGPTRLERMREERAQPSPSKKRRTA